MCNPQGWSCQQCRIVYPLAIRSLLASERKTCDPNSRVTQVETFGRNSFKRLIPEEKGPIGKRRVTTTR